MPRLLSKKIRVLVVDIYQHNRALPEEQIGLLAYESMSPAARKEAAVAHLAEVVWNYKRDQQLKIEREATNKKHQEQAAERAKSRAAEKAKREAAIERGQRYQEEKEKRLASGVVCEKPYPWNKKGRDACLECGCASCLAAYGEWDDCGASSVSNALKMMSTLMEDLTNSIRLELTEELLGSVFALGDGQRVTWGNATLEQHRQRADMTMQFAVANAEDAARHEAAIKLLEEHGVENLYAVAKASA